MTRSQKKDKNNIQAKGIRRRLFFETPQEKGAFPVKGDAPGELVLSLDYLTVNQSSPGL